MAKYYNSGTENLYKLYTQMKAMNITDNEFVEKLLVHVIFEGQVNDRLYELYKEYIKGVTRTVIRKAFYSYVTYNYFVKKSNVRIVFGRFWNRNILTGWQHLLLLK